MKQFLLAALAAALCAGIANADADPDKIYTVGDTVDAPAHFPGGDHLFKPYIDQNISNPQATGYDKPVYVSFVVTPFYEIDTRSIKALRRSADGTSYELVSKPTPYEKALMDVIRRMPGFVAAEVDGEFVNYRYILALNAELEPAPVLPESVAPKRKSQGSGTTSAATTLPHGQRAYEGERVYNGQRLFTQWDRLQQRPEFPGGPKAMFKAMKANLKRPHVYSHQSTIYCAFVVLPNGDIDPETVKCLHKHPDGRYTDVAQYTAWENAIIDAVAQSLGGFYPAMADGEHVPYLLIVPFNFQ